MSDNANKIRIETSDLAADGEGRFSRFELISWWEQARLSSAKVLVVGAGALGNEIIKNLALLGVGNVLIADLDTIEHSNLSRSVLYREGDIGEAKASVAARAAKGLFPQMNAHAFVGNAIDGLGAGAYRWADVIIGGLDNRECRLHVNRQAWRFGKPWVDGAIEQIQGVARVFAPDAEQKSPCYECTLGKRDWELLAQRRSCNMLTRDQMAGGRTPTTPTISAIIAGIQTQEAVKLLHGLDSLAGRGITFIGATAESFGVDYQRRGDCLNHETLPQVITVDAGVADLTLGELLRQARDVVGAAATIEFGRDIVERFDCPTCRKSEDIFTSLGSVRTGRAICPCDGVTVRVPVLFHQLTGDESFLDRRCGESGIPAFDVVTARGERGVIGIEFGGDAVNVLGPLHTGGLSWM